MAFTITDAADSSRMRRAFSVGPVKLQFLTYTCATTDTSATITCDALAEVSGVHVEGICQTAAATFSGNTITLTFNAPGATGATAGSILAFGV